MQFITLESGELLTVAPHTPLGSHLADSNMLGFGLFTTSVSPSLGDWNKPQTANNENRFGYWIGITLQYIYFGIDHLEYNFPKTNTYQSRLCHYLNQWVLLITPQETHTSWKTVYRK